MFLKERSEPTYALVADIGGTTIRAALVTPEARVTARATTQTEPERGFEDATQRLVQLLGHARLQAGDGKIVGLGVSTAGPLDPATGTYQHPPNLTGWHGRSMKSPLEQAIQLPV